MSRSTATLGDELRSRGVSIPGRDRPSGAPMRPPTTAAPIARAAPTAPRRDEVLHDAQAYRRELIAHCYKTVGSVHEAEARAAPPAGSVPAPGGARLLRGRGRRHTRHECPRGQERPATSARQAQRHRRARRTVARDATLEARTYSTIANGQPAAVAAGARTSVSRSPRSAWPSSPATPATSSPSPPSSTRP
ncbi:MAG: hypothetical protein QOD31_1348 [Pseudonocardiales bacterium]|nr:hypothetical protein [Pseudonocardiales bacterium]